MSQTTTITIKAKMVAISNLGATTKMSIKTNPKKSDKKQANRNLKATTKIMM